MNLRYMDGKLQYQEGFTHDSTWLDVPHETSGKECEHEWRMKIGDFQYCYKCNASRPRPQDEPKLKKLWEIMVTESVDKNAGFTHTMFQQVASKAIDEILKLVKEIWLEYQEKYSLDKSYLSCVIVNELKQRIEDMKCQ